MITASRMKGEEIMGLFRKEGGIMDVIRCDEPSYLIWKWHLPGSQKGNGHKENAVRWGSSLRVKDGEVAVFVYKQKDGITQDFIEGPFDRIIQTTNFPILASIVGLAYDGASPFQAEIYFINLAKIIQIRFAVPYFDLFDPRFLDFGIPAAVRGTITFQISNYREFIKLHRLNDFDLDQFQNEIRDTVIRYIKNVVANIPAEYNMPVLQIERKTAEISDIIEPVLIERLKETFGVTVSGVDISTVEIDKTSEGYAQLRAITQDVTTATIQAQTATNIKDIQDKQRIQAENLSETLRIQREEGQYAQHKQTQSANIDAFQVEKQAEVGVAGANALGQMGANGAGSIDLGGGTGFNPAAMMAGMAVGGAIGQNMAGTVNSMMSGVNHVSQAGSTPPPVPIAAYNVAINGQAAGPFGVDTLQQMITAGQLSVNSLVWKAGMSEWVRAGSVEELNNLFNIFMPPVPDKEE